MIKKRNHKLYIFISLLIVFTAGCEELAEEHNTPDLENPIKIGVVGDVSVLREQVENIFFGVQLASEEINNFDGVEIDGQYHDIELIYENSAGSAQEGIDIVKKFVDDGIKIIIGPTFSSVALEMAETCIKNDVLMMTYSATWPSLSLLDDNDLIWRTCPSDYTFGIVAAQYSYDSLEHRNAAILYRNDRFGKSLSNIIQNKFVALGGEIKSLVPYPDNIVDVDSYNFSYELNTLFKEDIDVVFIISFNSEIAKITNDIYNNERYQDFNVKPNIILSDGIIPEELIKNGNPELLETVIGITSTNTGNPNYCTYKTNYKNRFGFSPVTYSEHAYDALYCISYAMQKANSLDPNEIKTFLREVSGIEVPDEEIIIDQIVINANEFDIGKNMLKIGVSINYEGASGKINFDLNGDPIPKFVIWGIENNEFVELSYYGK
ncbi:MAG: ABC transporter substrate-binding protein [Bacteroidales bacterium]|nr:ABC transporter substrate-binding protein [Bacteroidales bacterium]